MGCVSTGSSSTRRNRTIDNRNHRGVDGVVDINASCAFLRGDYLCGCDDTLRHDLPDSENRFDDLSDVVYPARSDSSLWLGERNDMAGLDYPPIH